LAERGDYRPYWMFPVLLTAHKMGPANMYNNFLANVEEMDKL